MNKKRTGKQQMTSDNIYLDALKNAQIAESTTDNYINGLNRIKAILEKQSQNSSIDYILNNADAIYPLLSSNISNKGSLKTTIASVLGVMKHCNFKSTNKPQFAAWYRRYRPLLEEVNRQEKSSIPTERQTKGMVRWGDVIAIRNRLGKVEYGSRDHLLLSMYTYLAPRRQEDYHRVFLITTLPYPDKMSVYPDYLDLTKSPPLLVINSYKTAKTFDAWEKELTNEYKTLVDIIKYSIRVNPREYLFTQANGEPYTNTIAYTRFSNRVIKKYFGKDASLNSLRHAAVKASLTDGDKSYDDQNKYAIDMGHGFDTHRKYNKIDPKKAGIMMTHTTTDPATGLARTMDCVCVEKPKKAKKSAS
jgi:hypothetical protein